MSAPCLILVLQDAHHNDYQTPTANFALDVASAAVDSSRFTLDIANAALDVAKRTVSLSEASLDAGKWSDVLIGRW